MAGEIVRTLVHGGFLFGVAVLGIIVLLCLAGCGTKQEKPEPTHRPFTACEPNITGSVEQIMEHYNISVLAFVWHGSLDSWTATARYTGGGLSEAHVKHESKSLREAVVEVARRVERLRSLELTVCGGENKQ